MKSIEERDPQTGHAVYHLAWPGLSANPCVTAPIRCFLNDAVLSASSSSAMVLSLSTSETGIFAPHMVVNRWICAALVSRSPGRAERRMPPKR